MIGDKVRNGFLNAGSIGFRPTVIGNDPIKGDVRVKLLPGRQISGKSIAVSNITSISQEFFKASQAAERPVSLAEAAGKEEFVISEPLPAVEKKAAERIESPGRIRGLRRDIARIKTIMRERSES